MKRALLAMFGMMAIGGTTAAPALAHTDAPKWEASLFNLTNTLRKGPNLVELGDHAGAVVLYKMGDQLLAWATSGQDASPLPDGSYALQHNTIVFACSVSGGVVTDCQ